MAQTGQSALPCASYLVSAPAKAPNSANVFRSQYAQVANYCAAQCKDFAPPLTARRLAEGHLYSEAPDHLKHRDAHSRLHYTCPYGLTGPSP